MNKIQHTKILSFYLIMIITILFDLGNTKCYNPVSAAKKLKSESNCIKFIKVHCKNILSKQEKELFGIKSMLLNNTPDYEDWLYLSINNNSPLILRMYQNQGTSDLAHQINHNNCLKERIDEEFHSFFNFMVNCIIVRKKPIVVLKYFSELSSLKDFIFLESPLQYSIYNKLRIRNKVDQIMFDLANALNILHQFQISVQNISLSSIKINEQGVTFFTEITDFIIDPEVIIAPRKPDHYTDPYLMVKRQISPYKDDIYRLGIIFFHILNGIKSREFLHHFMGYDNWKYIKQDIDQITNVFSLRFPSIFVWMNDMLRKPQRRLSSNEVVKMLAESISVKVQYNHFGEMIPADIHFFQNRSNLKNKFDQSLSSKVDKVENLYSSSASSNIDNYSIVNEDLLQPNIGKAKFLTPMKNKLPVINNMLDRQTYFEDQLNSKKEIQNVMIPELNSNTSNENTKNKGEQMKIQKENRDDQIEIIIKEFISKRKLRNNYHNENIMRGEYKLGDLKRAQAKKKYYSKNKKDS